MASPVRLRAQPAQVLAVLLAHPGQMVARRRCPPPFGHGNLRRFQPRTEFLCSADPRSALLGDSGDSPRYVKTLPKRGYQFIAPVAAVDAPTPPEPPKRDWRWAAPAAALLMIAIFLLGRPLWTRNAPVQIAVTRFENETGDPRLDRFADGLTDSVFDLTQADSGRYGVIGNADILRLPRAKRNLLAIASSLKVRYVVLGQVQGDSSHPRILAHLIRVPEQAHLWVTRENELSLADPQRAQTEMAQRITAEFTAA